MGCGLGWGLARMIVHPGSHEVTPSGTSRRAPVEGAIAFGLLFTAPTGRQELGGVDEVVRNGFPGAHLKVAVKARIVCMGPVLGVGKAKGSGQVFRVRGGRRGLEKRRVLRRRTLDWRLDGRMLEIGRREANGAAARMEKRFWRGT